MRVLRLDLAWRFWGHSHSDEAKSTISEPCEPYWARFFFFSVKLIVKFLRARFEISCSTSRILSSACDSSVCSSRRSIIRLTSLSVSVCSWAWPTITNKPKRRAISRHWNARHSLHKSDGVISNYQYQIPCWHFPLVRLNPIGFELRIVGRRHGF